MSSKPTLTARRSLPGFSMPLTITLERAKGFTLFMMRAVLNGHGDEILDLPKVILSNVQRQEKKGRNNNGYAAAIDKGIRFTG